MPTSQNGSTPVTLTRQNNLLTLRTAGKYVDEDVKFNIGVRDGIATMQSSATTEVNTQAATKQGVNIGTYLGTKVPEEPNNGYYVRFDNTSQAAVTVATPGWIDNGDIPTASANDSEYYPVNEASFSKNCSVSVTPIALVDGANVILAAENTGMYVSMSAGASAQATAYLSASEPGFVDIKDLGTADATAQNTINFIQFISGAVIPKPASGTRSFTLRVPDGSGTMDLVFSVDSEGSVFIE